MESTPQSETDNTDIMTYSELNTHRHNAFLETKVSVLDDVARTARLRAVVFALHSDVYMANLYNVMNNGCVDDTVRLHQGVNNG